MNILQSVVLGVVEGLTEFLPVSSTGHLTIAEKALGLKVNDNSVTGFTAVIQVGAVLAVLLYFRRDIGRFVASGVGGLFSAERRAHSDFRLAWLVVLGSVPIGVVGFAAKDVIKGDLRSLWVVAVALIAWSLVMVVAERRGRVELEQGTVRGEQQVGVLDALTIGLVQCVALVPGVSRSGATISAGLLRGLDRVTATRLSFFLAIPALVAAGAFELKDATSGGVGAVPTAVGTVVSFVVAYASIAWLLKFVATHSIARFVPYRVLVGVVLLGLLAGGAMNAR
ncbi:MAG: undecaprenyl-diphosphatase [Frankiales bacterium]|nr:undecaprenyl-diphosphatase [Frankiales bacterium]